MNLFSFMELLSAFTYKKTWSIQSVLMQNKLQFVRDFNLQESKVIWVFEYFTVKVLFHFHKHNTSLQNILSNSQRWYNT